MQSARDGERGPDVVGSFFHLSIAFFRSLRHKSSKKREKALIIKLFGAKTKLFSLSFDLEKRGPDEKVRVAKCRTSRLGL